MFRGNSFGLDDYDNYKKFYELVSEWSDVITASVPAEIGFRFFSFIGNSLNLEGQFIIALMGLLGIFPILYAIKKYSEYQTLSLFIWLPYFFTMNMHSSRVAVAAGFGLLFLIMFFQRRYLFSLFAISIAIAFHKSAVILVLVLLTILKIEFLFAFLLFSFFILIILNPVALSATMFSLAGLHSISDKVIAYSDGRFGYSMPIYDPRILLNILISITLFGLRKKVDLFTIYLSKLFVVGATIMILFSPSTIIAWRGSYYFLLVGVILIPLIAKDFNLRVARGSNIKMLASLFFILAYGSYILFLMSKGQPFELYTGNFIK